MSGFDFPDLSYVLPFIRLLLIILIPIGVILVLYGYKIYKVFLAFFGFSFGFIFGAVVGAITDQFLIISLLSGLLGSITFYFLYKVGVFFLGFGASFFVALFISSLSGDPNPYFVFIAGLAGGVGALFVEKAIIIFFSSYQGAVLIISGIAWVIFPENQLGLFNGPNFLQAYLANAIIQNLLVLLLTVFGILYQYQIIPNNIDSYLPQTLRHKIFSNSDKTLVSAHKNVESNNRYHYETLAKPGENVYINPEDEKKSLDHAAKSYDHRETWMEKLLQQPRESQKESTSFSETVKFPCKLEILSGPESGFIYDVNGIFNGDYYSATIGRKEAAELNHIQIADPNQFISREHAEFALKDNHVYVRSLSSVNPLFLNDITVSDSVFEPMNNHDILKMGQIQLSVVFV